MIEAMKRAAREAAAFQLSEFRSSGPGWGNAKAAGLLLLSETGHDYRNFAGEEYDLFKDRGFVSARPGIMESLMNTVRTEYAPIR